MVKLSEELENFYRARRLYGADSVAPSVFDDPANASMAFNSSLPLNVLEKNIKSYPTRLELPYNPTFREQSKKNILSALEYLQTKGIMDKSVREQKATQSDIAQSFSGTRDDMGLLDFTPIVGSVFASQEASRDLEKAEPDRLKRSLAQLSFMTNPVMTTLARPDIGLPLLDQSLSALEFAGIGYLARPFAKKFKDFIKSVSKKVKNEPTTDIVPTKKPIGALPKMLPSTKRASPNLVMTDPKVVDEFGFYSEAERQAKMMQQNKGSGAQFAGLLLNKGVKQDELDAVGLTDLFENNANVTKKDIIDTIELNKVALIETKKLNK